MSWRLATLCQEASAGDAPLKQRGDPGTKLEREKRKLMLESKKEGPRDDGEEKP